MPWHTLQSKWKDEAGCHYLDQEWEILKSITECGVFFKAGNCCSCGLSSVHFSAASFQFLYKRLMILLILFLQSQCFLFPAVQWISICLLFLYTLFSSTGLPLLSSCIPLPRLLLWQSSVCVLLDFSFKPTSIFAWPVSFSYHFFVADQCSEHEWICLTVFIETGRDNQQDD